MHTWSPARFQFRKLVQTLMGWALLKKMSRLHVGLNVCSQALHPDLLGSSHCWRWIGTIVILHLPWWTYVCSVWSKINPPSLKLLLVRSSTIMVTKGTNSKLLLHSEKVRSIPCVVASVLYVMYVPVCENTQMSVCACMCEYWDQRLISTFFDESLPLFYFLLGIFFFGSRVSLKMKNIVVPRLTDQWTSEPVFLCLLNAVVTGACRHAWLFIF